MRRATYEEKNKVVNLFEDNKSVNFVVGKSPIKRKILMEYSFENCYKNGAVYLSDDKKESVH